MAEAYSDFASVYDELLDDTPYEAWKERIIRLIREAYRLNKDDIRKDKDIIIIARNLAKEQGFTGIRDSLLKLLKHHGLLIKD